MKHSRWKLSLTERFYSKVQKIPDGCWLWTAAKYPDGYGLFKINGRNSGAHRVAYELEIGSIPKDKEVHHTCENRLCVNPTHLQLVGDREHMLLSPNWRANKQFKQTHCMRGHEFTPENTGYCKGHRQCITCKRAYMIKYNESKKLITKHVSQLLYS